MRRVHSCYRTSNPSGENSSTDPEDDLRRHPGMRSGAAVLVRRLGRGVEPFGRGVIEARSLGAPVVASAMGGLVELVERCELRGGRPGECSEPAIHEATLETCEAAGRRPPGRRGSTTS